MDVLNYINKALYVSPKGLWGRHIQVETSLQVEPTSSNNSLDYDLISSLVCIVPTAQCLPTLLVWCLLEKPSHAH